MSNKERTICLETLKGGAAIERFNDELAKVLQNIIDPNVESKTKRTITLQVEWVPNEERTTVNIKIKCKSALAPSRPVETFGYIGEKGGEVYATEYNPRQPELPMVGGKERSA